MFDNENMFSFFNPEFFFFENCLKCCSYEKQILQTPKVKVIVEVCAL